MEVPRVVWLLNLLSICFGETTYSSVRSDYEAFLSAYEDTGSSGKSISAGPIIPKDTATAAIDVYMNMALYAVMDFDAVEGKLEIVGSISMQWTDDVKTLKNVSFSSTIDTIFLSQDQVWTPNLVLMNAAESVESIGDVTYKIRYNMSSGVCQWNPRVLILASCTPDATYFPFDDQSCTLSIKPWGQDTSLIVLHVSDTKWDTSDAQGSSVWSLAETKSSVSISGSTYIADFELTIKRKPLFMMIVIVLPVLLLSLLTGFLFLLPPASGERVGFGITCFLSFVVLLQTLMDLLPDSSDPMSLLCYYVILMLTLSGVLSIVNIFLLRLYLAPGKDEVPVAFIYFYKTIRCKPCKICYRKTKSKLEPPCTTVVNKIKRAAVALYSVICRFRCKSCRRMKKADRFRAQDTVTNRRFRLKRLVSNRVSSQAVNVDGHVEDAEKRRDSLTISRTLKSGNGILTGRDIELVDESPDPSTVIGAAGNKNLSSQTDQETDKERPVETAIVDQHVTTPLVLNSGNKRATPQTTDDEVTEKEVLPEPSDVADEVPKSTAPPTDVSSGYGSNSLHSGGVQKRSIPKATIGINPSDEPKKNVPDDDIAPLIDFDDDSDVGEEEEDSDVDDGEELVLSNLTWEFVGQILDYFFLVTFVALQVTFTMFFLVPLGARY